MSKNNTSLRDTNKADADAQDEVDDDDDVVVLRGPFSFAQTCIERSNAEARIESAEYWASTTGIKRRSNASCDINGESPAKVLKKGLSFSTVEMVEEALLGNLVAPFLPDRQTFNNFAFVSRELHEVCKQLPAPWPRQKLPVEAVAQALSFSPCGRMLACCSRESIYIWNRQSGSKQLVSTGAQVTSVSFSPCGKYLASGHRSQTSSEYDYMLRESIEISVVRLWDTTSLRCVRVLQGDLCGGIFTIAFSPDSQYIAAGGADQSILLWHVEDGSCQKALHGHPGWIYSLGFSRDGKYLASAGEDETSVLLWDLDTQQFTSLTGHTESVHCVAFTPDGRFLASGSDDETVRLWDLHNNYACTVLDGNLCSVWAIACSPDSNKIVSGSRNMEGDQVIRVWDIKQQKSVSVIQGHQEFITSLAFSPGGRTLASGSFDCTVRTWNLATEDALWRRIDQNSGVASTPQ